MRFRVRGSTSDPGTGITYAQGDYESFRDLTMVVTPTSGTGRIEYRFEGAETGSYSTAEGLLWIGGLANLFERTTMITEGGGMRRELVLSDGSGEVTVLFPGGTFSTSVAPPPTETVDVAAFVTCTPERLELSTGQQAVAFVRVPDSAWPADVRSAGP